MSTYRQLHSWGTNFHNWILDLAYPPYSWNWNWNFLIHGAGGFWIDIFQEQSPSNKKRVQPNFLHKGRNEGMLCLSHTVFLHHQPNKKQWQLRSRLCNTMPTISCWFRDHQWKTVNRPKFFGACASLRHALSFIRIREAMELLLGAPSERFWSKKMTWYISYYISKV